MFSSTFKKVKKYCQIKKKLHANFKDGLRDRETNKLMI